MMKKYMVYYVNCDGHREGDEKIYARSKEEAIELYMRFFNVTKHEDVRVVPVYCREIGIESI